MPINRMIGLMQRHWEFHRNVVIISSYVLGRVTVDEMKSKKEFSDKRLRMFMWLHTQVGTFDDISSSRISKQ